MAAWRTLGILVVLLAVTRPVAAQPYPLVETVEAGESFRIRLAMKLAGEMQVLKEDKKEQIHLEATAGHEFPERILTLGSDTLPQKSARHYETAHARITVGKNSSEKSLRPERCLIVAQRYKDQLLCWCPEGSLTRSELEVCSEHFDTLAVTGVLPGKAAIGETWKLPNSVAQALCSYEGLIEQSLTGKLESVTGDVAFLAVTGTASGIDLGALTKSSVTASCKFDLKTHRLTELEWKQKDEREQGPASPATVIETTWKLQRDFLDEMPKELSDYALTKVPEGLEPPPAAAMQLVQRDPKDRYQLTHGREWQIVGQTEEHLIMRLMESGDFVAQVVISPWTHAEAGKHLSADEFKEAMNATPGWDPQEVLDEGERQLEKGYWVYRMSALGQMDGLKVVQSFYLVAGPKGDQAVLAFTLKQALAEKLGTRDLKLVDGIELSGESPK